MSAPTITSIPTTQQGQGQYYLPKQSVVEIEVNFTTPGNAPTDFLVELSLDNGATFVTATLHSAANGQNVTPPTFQPAMILIDVARTFVDQTLTPDVYFSCKVRLTATANAQSSTSFISGAFAIKSTKPTISFVTMANWIGQVNAQAAVYSIGAVDNTYQYYNPTNLPDPGTDAHLIRASLNPTDLGPGTSLSFIPFVVSGTFAFGGAPEGSQTVYFAVYDKFYNASTSASVTTYLQLTSPSDCVVQVTGTNGNSDFTGITINSDGTFTPDRSVTLNVSCISTAQNISLTFTILESSMVELTGNVGSPLTLNPANAQQVVNLTTDRNNPSLDNFNQDITCTIAVQFTDGAGNFTVVNEQIQLNTRIYTTAFAPLRLPTGTYVPRLHYVNTNGADTFVPQSMIMAGDPFRTWQAIFYPTTHAYPTVSNGDPDLNFIASDPNLSQMLPTPSFDPILITTTQNPTFGQPPIVAFVPDSDGRPLTTDWTFTGSKNYLNMESSSLSSLRYWVIDNTGYGDFPIEFEYFDMDEGIYGPPFNSQSPYRGDSVTIYDATAPGCLQLVQGQNGAYVWGLANSTLLKEIATYGGSGANIVNLTTGESASATPNGNFITDTIVNTAQVVIMLHTDANGTASGFKIKAGPRHDQIWFNYDIDYTNGQVWVHLNEAISATQTNGSSDLTIKKFYYDYITNAVDVNLEAGTVTFNTSPSGSVVTADYSYYQYAKPQSLNFVASYHDFVDYNEAPVYIVPPAEVSCTPAQKLSLYESSGYGRMVQNHTWDKDRGVLTIGPSGVSPSGYIPTDQRITSDYFHHTYTRLTSDQYGDLVFRDRILVADLVPNYPDYTWGDVKIVNEGDTTLEDMQVTFVPRGYDTDGDGNITLSGNNIVDQVLDINRPWDIQLGTKQETYQAMAMAINSSYIWPPLCPRLGGDGLVGNSGAGTIFGTWQNKVYGNVGPRTTVFGRAVWILGGSSGSAYPSAITAGQKRTSLELQGKYYASLLI